MAIKRVIIHLGMPKAGSTFIQSTLYNNAAELEKNGFMYLTEWGRSHINKFHNLFYTRETGHSDTFISSFLKNKQNEKSINALLKVISNSDHETLILSGEFFRTLYLSSTTEKIGAFIKKVFYDNNIDVTIIYYIRNPLNWINSWSAQIFFSSGYLSRNADFYETAIKQYNGIFNLQAHFSDCLKIIKFEDACQDKDGLAANFLKAIGFPESAIKNIDMSGSNRNESRSMEVIEFVHFVEAMEARSSLGNYKRYIPSRFYRELKPLRYIKGVKFDLPFQSKTELWARLQETVTHLKENSGIDYTAYKIPTESSSAQQCYSAETTQEFIEAFPKLNLIIQKYFLSFFEKKYMETAQEKFKLLYFPGSIPYTIYKQKCSFWGILSAKKNNAVRLTKKIIKAKIKKLR